MITIPRPRRELRVRDLPGALVIQDPTTGQSVHLGRESSAIWIALAAGHDTPKALCAAVADLSPALIRLRLQQLREGLLLDDDLWRRTAPVFETKAPRTDSLPLRLSPALQHRCVGCGGACTGVEIGPVSAPTLSTIEEHRLFEMVDGGRVAADCVNSRPYGAEEAMFMKRSESRCVMLTAENRCAVHTAGTAEAKPGVCQQFPYTFTRGRDAIYVSLQMECRSLTAALASGAEEEPEALLSALRVHSEGPIVNVLPDPIRLAPGVYVTQARYLEWWADREGSSLTEMADGAIGWVLSLTGGEAPEWLSTPHWGAAEAIDAGNIRAALLQQLGGAAALLGQEAAKGGRLVEQEQTDLLRKALLIAGGHVLLSPTHWRDEDGPVLLRKVVTAASAGHDLVRDGDLLYGIGRLQLVHLVTVAMSRLRAIQAGRVSVTDQDVNDALVITNVVLRNPYVEQCLRMGGAAVRAFAAPNLPYAAWMGVPHPSLLTDAEGSEG